MSTKRLAAGDSPLCLGYDLLARAHCLLLASCLLSSFANHDTPSEADLAGQLDEIERAKTNRHWKRAKDRLLEVLEEHRDERYVLLHWPSIQGTLEECSFWMSYDAPEPEDVVQGKLLSYSEKTGKLKIRYARDPANGRQAPWDFELMGDAWIHPVVFKGPYVLKLKAHRFGTGTSQLFACVIDGGNYCAAYFRPGYSKAFRKENGREVRDGADLVTDIVDMRRWLEVKVKNTSVSYYAAGRKVLSAKKPAGLWGRAGFTRHAVVDEVEISGEVETAWIQGLIDERVHTARAEFEAKYDVTKDAPDWLMKIVSGEGSIEPTKWPPYPGHDEDVKVAEELVTTEDAAALLARAESSPESVLTEDARAWFLAQAYSGLERFAEALEQCERVCVLDPEYFPAHVLRVALVARVRSTAESLGEAQDLFAHFPMEPDAAATLARLLLLDGRVPDAQSVLSDALTAGLSPTHVQDLVDLLFRARNGPTWERTFEWKTKHYVVRSDLSRELCFDAAKVLEDSYVKWNLHLRRVTDKAAERYAVYLFSGRAGYMAYAKDLLSRAPENTAGLYSPSLKQLLIWNLPERESMFRTIRHEGFHQYFDQVAPGAPVWFNEGLAEYYETTERVSGRWKDGALAQDHLRTLRKYPYALVPFAELARMSPKRFYDNASLHYAQAWAFVHFLRHSDGDGKQLFDAYLDALIERENPRDAFDRAFAGLDFNEFALAFREYVDGV